MSNYCIYLLQCSDNSYYCGITTNINRRLLEHNSGKGSKYVRSRLPASILYNTDHKFTRSEASKLEYRIKQLPRKDKLGYIQSL